MPFRPSLAVVVVVAAVVVADCGGSGASPVSTRHATTAPALTAASLTTYLQAITEAHARTNPGSFQSRVNRALNALGAPGPGWRTTARLVGAEAADLDREAAAYRRVRAIPAPLVRGQARYTAALVAAGRVYRQLAANLTDVNPRGVVADLRLMASPTWAPGVTVTDWRATMVNTCARLRVAVPAWLRNVGSPQPSQSA